MEMQWRLNRPAAHFTRHLTWTDLNAANEVKTQYARSQQAQWHDAGQSSVTPVSDSQFESLDSAVTSLFGHSITCHLTALQQPTIYHPQHHHQHRPYRLAAYWQYNSNPISAYLGTSLVSLLRPTSAARGEIRYWSPDLWVGRFDHWGSHIRLVLAFRYYRRETNKSLSLLLWKATLLLIFSRDCSGYWPAVRKFMTAGQGHRSFDNTKSLENMANGESSSWQLWSSARHLSVFAIPQKFHPPPSMLRIPGPGHVDRCMSPVRLSIMAHIPVVVEPKISPNACQHCRRCSRLPFFPAPLFPQIWHRCLKKKPYLITRSPLYSYINAGQQSPMVGTELAAAQPLDTVAPHHPGPASQQSPAQRSVKCRYFASRKGRQFCS